MKLNLQKSGRGGLSFKLREDVDRGIRHRRACASTSPTVWITIFMRRLRSYCEELKPGFALIGEVLFGDYNLIVNDGMLHSCYQLRVLQGDLLQLQQYEHVRDRALSEPPVRPGAVVYLPRQSIS